MNELIKITQKDGRQVVSARELYNQLGLANGQFSRWAKSNIIDNPFAIENEDWVRFDIDVEGNKTSDYVLVISFAKKIAMMSKTDIGNKIRDYFLECEKKSQEYIPKTYSEALMLAAKQAERIEQQQKQIELKDTIISEYKPKANYYDVILSSKNAINISVIAKDYGMSAKLMNKKLNELGVIFKSGDTWLPYAKYAKEGYTKTETISYNSGEGSTVHSKWTQKGRLFLYDLIKKNGILPLIEK